VIIVEKEKQTLVDFNNLPDIQHSETSEYPIYLNSVGVEKVKVPFKLDSLYGGTHNLIAEVEMTTDLREDIKGISMGMLLRSLMKYLDKPLKHQIIKQILEEFKTAVETDSEHSLIKFDFELPINKKAPKSNIVFPQYYKCGFVGKLDHDKFRFFQKVQVFYGSYCPCSASLCNHLKDNDLKGFPHAQRSHADLLVEIEDGNIIWLESLIELIENAVKTSMFPVLRRIDEQEVARIAAENPMFVEDSIRRIVHVLNQQDCIYDWIIRCVHMESIHVSNAISTCWKGIEKGFRGTHYF
jgi:GTP cyclohydrolase I